MTDIGVNFLSLQEQDAAIRGQLHEAAIKVINTGNYILGAEIQSFESAFATYCGAARAIGVASGLAALELILRGYGIGPGDEVIVPAHTFVGSAAPVSIVGAEPVFVDVNIDDYNLDASKLEAACTANTRAIIVVHLYGRPANMQPILEFAASRGLIVIEDAAQAHGATHRERLVGTLADAASFSFYPSKNLGASGDAGAVTTDDAELTENIFALRNCGQFEKNVHTLLPCNHRMDTLQAAMLEVRLGALDEWNTARRRVAALYAEALAGLPLILPLADDLDNVSAWHLYVIRHEQRDALKQHLQQKGIETAIHYPRPVHLQPFFRQLGYSEGAFPIAEKLTSEILSLPMHPNVTEEQVAIVADAIETFSVAAVK